MGLHSARRQEQRARDLRIRQALTDQVDDCRLGGREAGPTAARPPPRWGPPARNPMECALRRARSESEVTPRRSYPSRASRRARLARWLSPCSAASSAASSCAHAAPKASPAAANRSAARVTAATSRFRMPTACSRTASMIGTCPCGSCSKFAAACARSAGSGDREAPERLTASSCARRRCQRHGGLGFRLMQLSVEEQHPAAEAGQFAPHRRRQTRPGEQLRSACAGGPSKPGRAFPESPPSRPQRQPSSPRCRRRQPQTALSYHAQVEEGPPRSGI
jgi:hypothetical protein